jgi:hypothetical protein
MHYAVPANIKVIPVIIIFFPGNFPAGLFRILFSWTILQFVALHNFPTVKIASRSHEQSPYRTD